MSSQHLEKVRALCATPRIFAIGGVRAGAASQITFFDHIVNKPAGSVDVPSHVLALSSHGDQVIAGCANGRVRIYDTTTGELTRSIPAHEGSCTALAVSTDGARLVTGGTDGMVREWKLSDGSKLREWSASSQAIRAVAIDPASDGVAGAGDDGVVRVFTGAGNDGGRREMTGHTGPVLTLAYTPRDGRLGSAGDDGSIRLWYLVGDVESEVRGEGNDGHVGAITAILFPPTPPAQPDGTEPGDRVYSAGIDGKVKVWRLDDRRKPRTLDLGAQSLHALTWIPGQVGPGKLLGSVLAAGDSRNIHRIPVDEAGAPPANDSDVQAYSHGFAAFERSLLAARPLREATVKALAKLDDPEALDLLLKVLENDKEPEVRTLAAEELGRTNVRKARAALRTRLDDVRPVRFAAFEALRSIEKDTPLGPLRAALESKHSDLRVVALQALAELGSASPLVPGLVAKRLSDGDFTVEVAALDALLRLAGPDSAAEPLRTGYERGSPRLRGEVLVRIALATATSGGAAWWKAVGPIVARALDDADAEVRRLAFATKVLQRPALAQLLEAREAEANTQGEGEKTPADEDFTRAVVDIARRVAMLTRATPADAAPTDDEVKAARSKLFGAPVAAIARMTAGGRSGSLDEQNLEPLLTAMACRDPETALRGSRGLARLGDARALGALLQLSRHPEAQLRRQAATALRELADPRAQKRLVWMLDDTDAAVRSSALIALTSLEKGSPLTTAGAALRSSYEEIRLQGLHILVKLGAAGERSPEALTLLGDAIEDEATKVRGEAFRTLWSWHDKDPQVALDRALGARFPDVRRTAVAELAALAPTKPWAMERLEKTIGDREVTVAQAAYEAAVKLRGKFTAGPHLLAMASVHPALRTIGARGLVDRRPDDKGSMPPPAPVDVIESARSPLMKLLQDDDAAVRVAAIDALYMLILKENGPLIAGLQSSFLDLRVRAAELLAARRDDQLINPMKGLLADKDLFRTMPLEVLRPLRLRAAAALATLGSPRTMKYFATELLKDEYPDVREQAARGMATACAPGEEGYLLDAMGHADLAVRSWAAEGLARRGDARALPVLTGTLRHEHAPIRIGAILSFAALGPEGYAGMLQGLEDPSKEIEEIVFAIILARDLRAFRKNEPPDLLTSALSALRPEVRFVAARAIELRIDPEAYLAHVVDVYMPPKPEKVAEMKDWPSEEMRARLLVGLAESLSSDIPEQRYAAAQVLRLRYKPLDYFREAQRATQLRGSTSPWTPDTQPRGPTPTDVTAQKGWLRRLFSGRPEGRPSDMPPGGSGGSTSRVPEDEQKRLRSLAFGAYVGLLRQAQTGEDEGFRVRREAIERIVELASKGFASLTASIPTLVRALDDGHHLVRRAALAGLKALFPNDPNEPLALALLATSGDIARAALDELAGRGDSARPRIVVALNSPIAEVRRYAFELLERSSPKGSLEPLLAALGSDHADLRIGVIERLASSNDPRVAAALGRAMESEHEDLRLRAAELLATRKDDRAVDVLATFVRADEDANVVRARDALVRLGSPRAVAALAARMEEVEGPTRAALVRALARIGALARASTPGTTAALEVLTARFDDESTEVRNAALDAALEIVGKNRQKRLESMDAQVGLLTVAEAAARSKDPVLRLAAVNELEVVVPEHGATVATLSDENEKRVHSLLTKLFSDRDVAVRAGAVDKYKQRVVDKGAPVGPLEMVLRAGARELMLPAAEAVAFRGLPDGVAALRPLLLYVRAGEGVERERALLALGTLGDARALGEIEVIAAGGTKEAPADVPMQAAAVEALGRIAPKLTDEEARRRATDRVEQSIDSREGSIAAAALRGLRLVGGERARVLLEGVLIDDRALHPVRLVAAQELGKLGDRAAEQALARTLDVWQSDLRLEARRALDRLFPNERTRVEFLAVGSQHTDVAEPAATFLAKEGDPALLVPRLATLKDKSLRELLRYGLSRRPELPVSAVAALLAVDTARAGSNGAWLLGAWLADPARAKKLGSGDRATLTTALLAAERRSRARWLGKRGDERTDEAATWRRVVWALSRLGSPNIAIAFRTLLGETDAPASVRAEAARGLGALGAQASAHADALVLAMSTTDLELREAAAAALVSIDAARAAQAVVTVRPFDPIAFGPQLRIFTPTPEAMNSSEGRRLGLPTILAAADRGARPAVSGHVSALIHLAAVGSKGDDGTRLEAVMALGRIGGDEAIAYLKTLAFEAKGASEAVRKAAYRSLRRGQRRLAKTEDRLSSSHLEESDE